MSHELRTPLNAIIGFSEMLTDDSLVFDAARKREYAKLINESGHHLLSVVNGILDMSKMETGNFEITPEPFTPAPAIVSCCDLLALKARDAGVEIKTRIPADAAGDRRRPARLQPDPDQPGFQRHQVHAARRQDHRQRVVRRPEICASPSRIPAVGIGESDLPRLGEAFFQARASYDRQP